MTSDTETSDYALEFYERCQRGHTIPSVAELQAIAIAIADRASDMLRNEVANDLVNDNQADDGPADTEADDD